MAKDDTVSPPVTVTPLSAALSASLQSLPAPLPPVPLSLHYFTSSFQLIIFFMRVVIWFFPSLGLLKRHSKMCPLKRRLEYLTPPPQAVCSLPALSVSLHGPLGIC